MKCFLGISNFLEDISSFSHSLVFLYFFALIAEEGFLISPCYSLEFYIQMDVSFLFSFAFHVSSFTAMCKASSDNRFASWHFFFLGMVLIAAACTMSRTCMITHLEPDILEWEVKWALGSITTNKASGGDGIPVELFQILKHDVVKVLHSVCQQIWKTQQWSQDWKKVSFHSNPKDGQCQKMFKLLHNCTHLTR